LELAYEARVLAPNAALAQVLHEARQQGKRVVATSDMYLSSAAIHRLVAEKLPTPPLDTIYVSSEQRINKASGALYAFVAQREGAETQEIAHCGDNHGSDVAQAHAAGIRAVHTPRPTIWHWRRRCKTRAFLTAHPELRTA
jgi:predicted HAD superfamily hydrolase